MAEVAGQNGRNPEIAVKTVRIVEKWQIVGITVEIEEKMCQIAEKTAEITRKGGQISVTRVVKLSHSINPGALIYFMRTLQRSAGEWQEWTAGFMT